MLAILTLFAGRRDTLPAWGHWLLRAPLPGKCALYTIDNSPPAAADFRDALAKIALSLSNRGWKVDIARVPDQCRFDTSRWAVHEHVAGLYNKALQNIADDILLTLEDDVVPPLAGYCRLLSLLDAKPRAAAVAGMVPCRSGGDRLIAIHTTDPGNWSEIVTIKDAARWAAKSAAMPVAGFGGGFTLWRMRQLRECLPVRFTDDPGTGIVTGWDGNLCRDLKQHGYKLYLETGTLCYHDFSAQGKQRAAVVGGDASGLEPICDVCHGRVDLGECECQQPTTQAKEMQP